MRDPDQQLPTFLVVGAMKSGTTSLHAYLAAHPQVFMTEPKEPHFFSWEWDRGIEWYRSLFEPAGAATARGECSVTYTLAHDTPLIAERVHGVVPGTKIVYLVRHPVDRVRSHHAFRVLYEDERRPIGVAVRADDRYLQPSRYAFHLEAFLDFFPIDRLLIVTSEQLRDDRATALARVFDFVGVDPTTPIPNLDTEYFRTTDVRRPRPWAQRVRSIARRTPLRLLPGRVNNRLYRLLRQRIPTSMGELSPDVERWLWEELAPHAERVRELTGSARPLWEPR